MSEASAHALDHHEPVTSTGIQTKKFLCGLSLDPIACFLVPLSQRT